MLGEYYYSREELVKKIKEAPTTDDGYYYYPKFKEIVEKIGKKRDQGYSFCRHLFRDKIVFSNADLETFLEKGISDVDINEMIRMDDYLNAIIKEFVELNIPLKGELPNDAFTLEELIDTSIFLYLNKYRF